jgi:hypothetical protein
MITVTVTVPVVIVAPFKIFPPFFIRAAAKIPMSPMTLIFPPVVINNFVVVPEVVVVVVAVMDTVTRADSRRTAGNDRG